MDQADRQAAEFERHRGYLQAVAYRMLGSVAEAEDAVQEAWLRLSRVDDSPIRNLRAWLTTVVGRVCMDMLRSRRSRRENLTDVWLPEPVVREKEEAGPEDEAVLADSVGLALLVVLETLAPAERLAFVLHDMFGMTFKEIASVVDRTPSATRQLASRARRRVRGAPPVGTADLGKQRAVAQAFLAAARAGDFEALVAVLHPDVVFRVDAGPRLRAAPSLVNGAESVARQVADQGPRFASLCRLALVNGSTGVVARTPSGVVAVAGLTVVGERISAIDLILDPDKLPTP
ncbi:MAG: RNA polymerase sigma factor SigJ [Nocardioides sp.]